MEPTSRRTLFRRAGAAFAAAGIAHVSAGQKIADLPDPLRSPDSVTIFGEEKSHVVKLSRSGDRWQSGDVEVVTGQTISLAAPATQVTRIRIRWQGTFAANTRFLGDHWERSYGDLEWRGFVGDRLMPWYFLASDDRGTHGYGVKTGSSAICYWQADAGGMTLWLDVSNGGRGVQLGPRTLQAATVVHRKGRVGESSVEAARAFCTVMCEKPRLASKPIYGSNNWYYAYGQNVSSQASLRDAELMAELMPALPDNKPYVVIDMGWGAFKDGAGPVAQTGKTYPDMPDLAAKMKAIGVRPGIWTRPTLTTSKQAEAWRLPHAGGRSQGQLISIDPSIADALAYIGESIRTIRGWGYELIKHDFSTFDLTGRWGFEMGPALTDAGWRFNDRSKTTAEIVLDLYRTIRESAGDAAVIGCNTIGHLAAGLVEAQRIGDDTSGREWARTRKMGVNTLAFRMAQHNTFFAADADCVPVTADIPWPLTKQWLDLVARSGTALFVSLDPAVAKAEYKAALKEAFAIAARPGPAGVPLDWMSSTTPERWRLDAKAVSFSWYPEG